MTRLQQLREGRKLSRSGLGAKAGMHPTTVGQIESGYIGRPYPSQLEKLARALDFSGDPAALLEDVSRDASN